MKSPAKLANSLVFLAVTIAGACLIYFQEVSLSHGLDEIPPLTQSMDQRLNGLKDSLNALGNKDPTAVKTVDDLFGKLVDAEEARNTILQQRAASLLSAAALIVSIILASISLMLKDARQHLKKVDVHALSHLLYLILLVFGASLYWTWNAFGTLPFVSFNAENLLENVAMPGAENLTVQIVSVQQRYQMEKINSALNTEKADALRWATADLFLGLVSFSIFCLILLLKLNKSASQL